ncbi:hypothetical protein OED52_17350 [Rhodococcus sp. Z13]|uniref:Uncharacterized protein n=1 Tax=Rhodococcus sacchari TaxID=2962047 RepID=A0ACD4DE94_9NOCA|nr:hypothetical protein [Rhodococcus sp. Z13]UYP18405.1 hypothetical protein OED52_17350 [Rhodococcus sp. Z13]
MSARPDEALVEPTASDPVPDLLERTLGLYYLSPSFYVAELCKFVVGTDPWAWAAQYCGGDWESVLRTSDGVSKLAAFHRGYATAVGEVHGAVAPWEGSAGRAAGLRLADLHSALDEQAHAVQGISGQLEQIALAMYELNQTFAEILSAITDAGIRVLVRLASTSVAAATGVGALGSAVIAASSLVDLAIISDLWKTAIDVHTKVWTTVQGLMGVLAGNLAKIENIEIPRLPTV